MDVNVAHLEKLTESVDCDVPRLAGMLELAKNAHSEVLHSVVVVEETVGKQTHPLTTRWQQVEQFERALSVLHKSVDVLVNVLHFKVSEGPVWHALDPKRAQVTFQLRNRDRVRLIQLK